MWIQEKAVDRGVRDRGNMKILVSYLSGVELSNIERRRENRACFLVISKYEFRA